MTETIRLPETIEHVGVDAVLSYAKNSRTHSPDQVAAVARSIRAYGFTNPILIHGTTIIAGHGRMMAARQIGMATVPAIRLDHLTEAEARAYVIADNRLAELAGWDEAILAEELRALQGEGFDLSLTGWEGKELDELLFEPPAAKTGADEAPAVQAVAKSKVGDVWVMGKHRLMCGDSTDTGSVALLMNGEKADMVFTDPPYNIDYQGVKDKREKIKNDKMHDDDFVEFLRRSVMPVDVMYVCCSWQFAHLFKQAMIDIGKAPKAMIVWDKVNPAQHLDIYFKQHEIIFYHGPFGGNKTVRGDVWQLKRQQNTLHPTMKPVELIEMALGDHPDRKTVYDGFGGSGSTLIACEKTGRINRSMELDPKYCDVIVRRWQNFTGQRAIHAVTGEPFGD